MPRARGETARLASFLLYMACVGGMFLMSGLYHTVDEGTALHRAFWYGDHGMIWLAIASTISIFVVLECERRAPLLVLIWGLALTGLACETAFLSSLPLWASPVLYVAMGWIGVFPLAAIVRKHGKRAGATLLVAGLLCTAGGIVDAVDRPYLVPRVVEAHEVMHVLILLGLLTFEKAVHESLTRGEASEAPSE